MNYMQAIEVFNEAIKIQQMVVISNGLYFG